MSGPDTVAWLRPCDAPEMSRLAMQLPAVPAAMGGVEWQSALAAAESAGRNLSVGLRSGRRLRGFLLAWIAPRDVSNGSPRVQLAAVGVEPGSDGARRLLSALCGAIAAEPDLRSATLEAYGEHPLYDQLITARAANDALMARLDTSRGYLIDGRRFEVGTCTTTAGWALLEPHWDRLLAETPGGAATQSFAYLRAWWRHLGPPDGLWIVVITRAGAPIAIAALQRCIVSVLGNTLRVIRFIGAGTEVDKPVVLTAADAAGCATALARYFVDRGDDWDRLEFKEQNPGNDLMSTLTRELGANGYLVSRAPGPVSVVVDLEGDATAYLGARNRALRRNLKRRRRRLEAAGRVDFEADPPAPASESLERFLALERSSWKVGEAAITADPRRTAFYRALTATPALASRFRFAFLTVNGAPVAATFGLCWRRRYQSLQICHAREWDACSPGVLLTALELQHAHGWLDCDVYDFLCGFEAGKLPWATSVQHTAHLIVDRPSLQRRILNWLDFDLRPRAKTWLVRSGLQPRALALKARLAARFVREGA